MIRAALILLFCASYAFAGDQSALEPAARELIVKWRDARSAQTAGALDGVVSMKRALPAAEASAAGLERISILRAQSPQALTRLAATLRNDPRVEYVEPRPVRRLHDAPIRRGSGVGSLDGVPDDPFYSLQWYLPAIEAEAAWNITRGNPSVVIAVLDVGVDFNHPELAPAHWENAAELNGMAGVDDDGDGYIDDCYGWDFVDNDNDPSPSPLEPPMSHGTHVAGIAAAARNNGMGIAGLAPDCKLMAVRVGSEHIPYGVEGIYYACRAGAKVINCSWGGDSESAYERDIVNYVLDRGCVLVASAGNDNSTTVQYPAGIEGVVSVAATGSSDRAASFTNRGPWVKIAAPGVGMISTVIGTNGGWGYDTYQGTSMSAPLVSAACALVASRSLTMSGRVVAARVISAADPLTELPGQLGLGRLNVWRALADSVSGVRLAGVTVAEANGNGDGRIHGGESASLNIAIESDMGTIASVLGEVTSPDANVTLNSPILVYEEVPTREPVWSTSQVTVTLAPDVQRGYLLPITIDWRDNTGRIVGRATTWVELDSTFVVVDNGWLALGFAEHGSLGYVDYVHHHYRGAGLRISDHSNALYHGSFIVAADGLVADNAYGDITQLREDWQAANDSVAQIVPSTRAEIEAHASFADRGAEQMLFAGVNEAALAWRDAARQKFMILEYVLTNHSVNPWLDAWAGFFLDWDLGSAAGNIAEYDSLSGIAYVRQVAPGHPLVGIASLSAAWGALQVIDNRQQIDPPAIWSDSTKWSRLHAGVNLGPRETRDISMLIACGPFTLDAHGQRTLAFALVTGESIEELRTQGNRAAEQYLHQSETPPATKTSFRTALYPNPLPPGENLRLVLPQGVMRAQVRIYNVLGQLVADIHEVRGGPGGLPLDRAALSNASGVLFYRIDSAAGAVAGKLLILK